MSHPPVELAIAGCGAITDAAHLPAAVRSAAVRVAALVDTEPANARALASKYSLTACTVSGDLGAVLDDVEAVLIATPNHTHFSLAQAALARGIPVLVEKPLTASHADAVALCELAERQRTFISVGYMTRHFPSFRLLKQLLDCGYLGKITSFHYEQGAKGGWEPVSGYSLDPRKAGGGVLLVRGTHFIDRMLHLFGYPESFVYADDNYGAVEANCSARLRFNNETASCEGSFLMSRTRPLRNQLTLHTDSHVCILEDEKTDSLSLWPRNRPDLALEAFPREGKSGQPASCFQVQLEEFASLVRNGGRPTVDGVFAAQSIKLIEDMYRQRSQLEEPWLTYRSRLPESRILHV